MLFGEMLAVDVSRDMSEDYEKTLLAIINGNVLIKMFHCIRYYASFTREMSGDYEKMLLAILMRMRR